tara:strand:- start:311 stop:616 length:306 start_codon:yes stop_codon:yes gene_type:complete
MSKKEQRIYERNPDTGQVKSRAKGDYGNEKVEYPTQEDIIAYNQKQAEYAHLEEQHYVRKEVLNELWAAPKVNHQGHWYVKLTDVVKIVGDYNELYENESR